MTLDWIQQLATMTAETDYQFDGDMFVVDGGATSLNASGYNYTPTAADRDAAAAAATDDDSARLSYESRTVAEIVVVVVVVVALSLITCAGNLLVIVSFKVDTQLQTVSNYFLLSLSVADLTIGLVSMPLYSVYLLMGYWPLGHVVCDAWLSLDYTMSNASVANLLVISFDRYFSVTRPLTYRVRRTSGRAAAMIAGAWTVSALLWTPWIVAWPHLEGRRTVPPLECYVQFLKTNKYFTIVTATAAFYLPVLIMTVLYFRIYRETEKRQKGLVELQGGASGGSLPLLGGRFVSSQPRSAGSDAAATMTTCRPPTVEDGDEARVSTRLGRCRRRLRLVVEFLRRRRRQDDVRAVYLKGQRAAAVDGSCSDDACRVVDQPKRHPVDFANSTSTPPPQRVHGSSYVTAQTEPQAVEPSVVVRELFRLPRKSSAAAAADGATTQVRVDVAASVGEHDSACSSPLIPTATGESPPPLERPGGGASDREDARQAREADEQAELTEDSRGTTSDPSSEIVEHPPRFVGERRHAMTLHRVALQACMAAKLSQAVKDRRERKRHQQEKKADRKAARTLSAVLLAFIVTWTPYNVFIIVEAFCTDCVHPTLYAIGQYTPRACVRAPSFTYCI